MSAWRPAAFGAEPAGERLERIRRSPHFDTAAGIFRRAVRDSGLSLEEAVRMSSTTPAALLGLSDRGAVSPGLRADLLVLDDDLGVRKVVTA